MTATFGKLEHDTLTLEPGLNVLEAPNEWGKTTWCAFLLAMLYGLDTRAKSTKTALADKLRYTPWSGSPMAGRIDLSWQGRDITIERSTTGRTPLGVFRAYETKTGLAIPELTAAGVTFPIKVQMPYNPSSTDWDKQCQVFKQQLEGVLNDGFDFIDIIITAGPSDSFLSSVRRNGKFAFLQCNWGADYSDPQTETDPFYQAEGARGSRYAFLRTGVEDGFITGDTADAIMNYMKAIEAAVEITDDINARYDAFANAEASLINNALVVPMGMSIPAYIATRLNYWEGQYASTGFSNKRLKGIHVLDHYISMSEYEANRDAR